MTILKWLADPIAMSELKLNSGFFASTGTVFLTVDSMVSPDFNGRFPPRIFILRGPSLLLEVATIPSFLCSEDSEGSVLNWKASNGFRSSNELGAGADMIKQ